MIEVLPAPSHVVALRISGTLTGSDFDKAIEAIEGTLARHDRIGALVDLSEFKDATLEAAVKDTRYDLSKVFQLHRFPREAVVSDKQWVHTFAGIASPLLPFVEIRAFKSSDLDAALGWVSGVIQAP